MPRARNIGAGAAVAIPVNYRHAFHAGNFADVVKHVVLVRILLHLARKDTPFRVIDTHAGAGAYDLAGEEASRTGEWRGGVGRLGAIDRRSAAGELLAPYLALIGADGDPPATYPGSPVIAQKLMRRQDRALFCETQPDVRAALSGALGRDRRVKVLDVDGWVALGAFLPPPERRGLVLIDPPFESPDDFARLAHGAAAALRKWPTGILMLWYPVKSLAARDGLFSTLLDLDGAQLLRIEFGATPVRADAGLTRAGLIIANPPHTLVEEMRTMLPALGAEMARGEPAPWTIGPLSA